MSKPPRPRRSSGRLKDGSGRSLSSRRWLERQLSDPYVAEARRRGYRSRAAFKLLELDDRFHLLRPGARVVDLGAAPGGWTQVAVERVGPGHVIALDPTPIAPIPGAAVLSRDVRDEGMATEIRRLIGGDAQVVLSDMAPPATGHASADHLRIMALAETAFALAAEILGPGGAFVCKVWQGGTESTLLAEMKQRFRSVRHVKPPASRAESAEIYVVGLGFRSGPP